MCIKQFSSDIWFSEKWNPQHSLLDMIILNEYLLIKYYCRFFLFLDGVNGMFHCFYPFVFIQSHSFILKGFQFIWILRQNHRIYREISKIFFNITIVLNEILDETDIPNAALNSFPFHIIRYTYIYVSH